MDPTLLKEVETAFPFAEMPLGSELVSHNKGCYECESLREDLEPYRGKDITVEVIRLIHQELYNLSAKAWQWILPYYLRFCLTPEAEYSRMETEFLIYNLAPLAEFEEDTLQRLSLLNEAQVECLIHFLEWCESSPAWKDYFTDEIEKAKTFLSGLVKCRSTLSS